MPWRLAIGQHVVPLLEPASHLALEDRLAVGRRQTLAVNHAHAAPAARTRGEQETAPARRALRRPSADADRARPAPPSGRGATWRRRRCRARVAETSAALPCSWPTSHDSGEGFVAVLAFEQRSRPRRALAAARAARAAPWRSGRDWRTADGATSAKILRRSTSSPAPARRAGGSARPVTRERVAAAVAVTRLVFLRLGKQRLEIGQLGHGGGVRCRLTFPDTLRRRAPPCSRCRRW